MQHPDEGMIHAWLDGELSLAEGAALESHVSSCAECSAAIAEARGLIAASSSIVSSLDVVPGDVIPTTRPEKRPWYSRTQFRAAAAVLFVAGASFVVLRPSGEASRGENAQQRIAGASAIEADGVKEGPAAPTDSRAMPAIAEREGKTTGISSDRSANQSVKSKGGRAQAAAADLRSSTAAAPPAVAQRSRVEELALSDLTVAGLNADTGLQLVRSDSTAERRVSTYRVDAGVEVTLTDTPLHSSGVAKSLERSRRVGATTGVSPVVPLTARAAASVISLTWQDTVSHRQYVLTGPLSKERLEVIRKRLEEDKR